MTPPPAPDAAEESRLLQEIIIPPGDELTPELQGKLGQHQPKRGVRLPELDGAVVNVEMTRFPRGGVAPSGRVIEILGRPGEFGVDVEILIRKHHLPHEFPTDVLAEAAVAAHPVGDTERTGRRDFHLRRGTRQRGFSHYGHRELSAGLCVRRDSVPGQCADPAGR
jgi:exoribonuclease R